MTTVLVAHVAVLGLIFRAEQLAAVANNQTSDTTVAITEVIQQQPERYNVPLPDLRPLTAAPAPTAPQAIRFDDSIDDELAAIISAASAPRLARVQFADPASFARRAHLLPGRAVTVVLRVEVTADGTVGAADVIRSSGNRAADAAAVDYALALRWIPGTIDHQPKAVRVSLPVTLFTPAIGSSAL
jgi:TonB family protein